MLHGLSYETVSFVTIRNMSCNILKKNKFWKQEINSPHAFGWWQVFGIHNVCLKKDWKTGFSSYLTKWTGKHLRIHQYWRIKWPNNGLIISLKQADKSFIPRKRMLKYDKKKFIRNNLIPELCPSLCSFSVSSVLALESLLLESSRAFS